MADNNADETVASLVEALVNFHIALGIADDEYQAALQHGISPDLAHEITEEKFQIAHESFLIASGLMTACTGRMMQGYAPQADAAGPSSSQPAPVQQDNVTHASEERISDVSEDFLDLDLNKSPKEKELVHDMAAPEEPVEQKTAAPEETVKNTATSEETLERNTASPEETVERDTASQEEAAGNDTIAPEETVEHSRPKKAARIGDL